MDNNEYENPQQLNPNTEYIPTKCRITRPPPPKPASNPLQFVKVAPCPLFKKAAEQIKKAEEIKKERKEIIEEAEDWQQNLDNWKSGRRKRQEHIIERVVEVKKMEQEDMDGPRRKTKTFSEMMEDRGKGRRKFNLPVYDDDSNDLSDYGIGSSSSKTNSIKDVDTDDSSSFLDEKEHKDSSASNQSQSEDEFKVKKGKQSAIKVETPEQYTYEGAINDYRTRIRTKVFVDESIFTKNQDTSKSREFSEAQTALPKGEIFKRKELFEIDKSIEINNYESPTARRLSEDFANTKSIKQRLQSLEKCTDQTLTTDGKPRLQNLSKADKVKAKPPKISTYLANVEGKSEWKKKEERCSSPETELYMDNLNRFSRDLDTFMGTKDKYVRSTSSENIKQRLQSREECIDQALTPDGPEVKPPKVSTNSKRNNEWKKKEERCSSPETELYIDNLKRFSRDLDAFVGKTNVDDNYAPSTSSTELMTLSSDREDSGIHTADVSCAVSQADEAAEMNELAANDIDKLTLEEDAKLNYVTSTDLELKDKMLKSDEPLLEDTVSPLEAFQRDSRGKPDKRFIQGTVTVLEAFQRDSRDQPDEQFIQNTATVLEAFQRDSRDQPDKQCIQGTVTLLEALQRDSTENLSTEKSNSVAPIKESKIYENVDFIADDLVLAPSTMKEPPKAKPPPPPPISDGSDMKRHNSTKRIKREMHIKRSSFLGLDEPTAEQLYPEMTVEKPPDIDSFLQKESKLEKSLYKKTQEENRMGLLSKVESHDSGLDIDRGRLSSDTWCSSIGDSTTPSPERHDSEQTNSITSEEDEITKKEREIIEMVEKEEKSRDYLGPSEQSQVILRNNQNNLMNEPYLGSESFNNPYFPKKPDYLDDQDSEVLKVEHELRQLEREELKRRQENLLFQESRAKARLQSRHSAENIFDDRYSYQRKSLQELDYRKSLPDVPNAFSVYTNRQYGKSMPDIQYAYPLENTLDHRKSMPDIQRSAFTSPPPIKNQPIMPGKPIRPMSKEQRDRNMLVNDPNKPKQLSRHSLQTLSAVPKNRHLPENWIQPRQNVEKNTKQHWLIQEAELRRLNDQKSNRIWPPRQEKHLPDSVIQTLTQRAQNRVEINERNRRSETSPSKEGGKQHSYPGHNQPLGHALPMPYPPPLALEENEDRRLSVSGKKKCSNCNKELGRGAAMIIESLSLFYHMECFICCVCHMQLGDGRMGTDVRVGNQKLHCHNCYSSDDGIKFSCV